MTTMQKAQGACINGSFGIGKSTVMSIIVKGNVFLFLIGKSVITEIFLSQIDGVPVSFLYQNYYG